MTEVRWCEKKTGKKVMNDWGFYFDETIQVLQYRNYVNNEWTQWVDVPLQKEEEDLLI